MDFESIITGKNLIKKYKGFTLSIEDLRIPKGFATALIGENGAGKSTLLEMMAGLKLSYQGEFTYFDGKVIEDETVKNDIGYTAPNSYYFPNWTPKQVREIYALLFPGFGQERYDALVEALDIPVGDVRNIKGLSDGNKMKLMLAGVLARDTRILLLDEPASPLDPLMRSRLCDMIQQYIREGEGERSVFFSTHNIADMENVTDYAILLHKGSVLEQGFVEDLKEKYVTVKADAQAYDACRNVLIGLTGSQYGVEGLCLSDRLEELAGVDISCETPTLSEICVGIMRQHSALKEISGKGGKK